MRNSFSKLLQAKVEIPIIQRDFAQGRTDTKTSKIRLDFLKVLFENIARKYEDESSPNLELDFIYGFVKEGDVGRTPFVPIDGQQRLTTLWLLYWFVAAKEAIGIEEKTWLKNFAYETRHSTTVFCEQLLLFSPEFSCDRMSKTIKDQHWYFDTWEYDPGIQAMLVVIDDIERMYEELKIDNVWGIIGGSNCPFHFYQLEMSKVGLTDDLYIKMNSRGKALTEFEYFKAGFARILLDQQQRERFERSVDQEWMEAVWTIVMASNEFRGEGDLAMAVDGYFLNLFNFITYVIAHKKDLRYVNTVASADLLKTIYSDVNHQIILFDTLDAICRQQESDKGFWQDTFHHNKGNFLPSSTRLFFPHGMVNLLDRCLFPNTESRGLSMPEQLLLHACFTFLKDRGTNFEQRIRVIRNLVVNSDSELRDSILGQSFAEVEMYIRDGDLSVFKSFKTDQIVEEKEKYKFLQDHPSDIDLLKKLEDSDVLRGSISLIDLDAEFGNRAKVFLEKFDEDDLNGPNRFIDRSNLLLCFGDYSQDAHGRTNLMTNKSSVVRRFLTSPGYNKNEFHSKTKKVVTDCLDFFVVNPAMSIRSRLEEQLITYETAPKDWKFYFIKYGSFREWCNQGYYLWEDGAQYPKLKMKEWKLTGYHWDPFLYELDKGICDCQLYLDNYAADLSLTANGSVVLISSTPKGFHFKNGKSSDPTNQLMEDLVSSGIITSDGEFLVKQNGAGIDLEDRIEMLRQSLCSFLKKDLAL